MIIEELIKNLQEINESLKFISDKGIPIIDTFAPITTVVNIGTTIFATALGGWITLQFFKRQEKMRIRNEIEIQFFKEYEIKYDNLYRGVEEVFYIIRAMSKSSEELEDDFEVENSIICEDIHTTMELLSNIMDDLNKLRTFMENRTDITGFSRFNFEDADNLITSLYYWFIGTDLHINEFKSNLVEEYNRTINAFGSMEDEAYEALEKLNEQDLKIRKKFIGKYFEVKWYQKIFGLPINH